MLAIFMVVGNNDSLAEQENRDSNLLVRLRLLAEIWWSILRLDDELSIKFNDLRFI